MLEQPRQAAGLLPLWSHAPPRSELNGMTRSDWLIPPALIALGLVPAIAGAVRIGQLAGGASITPDNARFFAAPLPVVAHILASVVLSIAGAFQFSPGLRRRYRGWHQMAGRLLIPCALVSALTGLWMTLTYPWPPNDGAIVFAERLLVGIAMLVSVGLSVDAIRRRQFANHGAWMLRAYAIGMGAGTQVLTHLPWFVLMDSPPGETPRAIMMGLGWGINIVIAEWLIRRSVAASAAAADTSAVESVSSREPRADSGRRERRALRGRTYYSTRD